MQWFEDDNFWLDCAEILFGQRRLEAAPEECSGVEELLDLQPGQSILDLCCGVGRHTVELAARGYQMTGVDRTALYLERAGKSARERGVKIEFIHEDMRRFRREGAFDAVINLFTSFGYFEDAEDDRTVMQNIFDSLKPGGCLLLDTLGKERIAKIFMKRHWDREDGVICLQEREVKQDWGWMENRWIFLKGDKRLEHRFGHRLYAATELKSLAASCGFDEVDVFGGFDDSPYDQNAIRLVMRARKPAE